MKRTYIVVCGLCAAVLCSVAVAGGPYPEKPIRFVVPFAAGGGSDFIARLLSQKMSEPLGQQVVVDNRPGAGGLLGTEIVAKSSPDGYTIVLIDTPFTVNITLYSKPGYSAEDFAPVTVVATAPLVLVTNASLPSVNLKEFVALAKSQPNKLTMASGGNGGIAHLAGELFRMNTGVSFIHVPYKGIGPAMLEVLGGQVQFMFSSPPAAIPHLKSGKVRALAVTSVSRYPSMPDIPTMAEGGVKDYAFTNWYGIAAPARTPAIAMERLFAELAKAVRLSDLRERFASAGLEPVVSKSPRDFAGFVASEVKKWGKVVKDSGMKVE